MNSIFSARAGSAPIRPMSHASASGGVGEFAGLGVGHVADGDAEAVGDGAGHVGGDADRVAVGGAAGDEEEVAEVDAGAKVPVGASSATICAGWLMGALWSG